jgi:ribokinase
MADSKKCVVVGGCTVDFLVRPLNALGDKTYAEILQVCPGGGGRNVALGLRKMGLDVTILASVGNDAFGDMIVDELRKANVHTRFVQRVSALTGFSLIDTATGKLISVRGANQFLHLPAGLEHEAFDYIYLGSVPPEFQRAFCKYFRCEKPIFINPGPQQILDAKEELLELIRRAWLVQMNLKEARLFFACEESAREAAKKLVALGPYCAVVTAGLQGTWAVTEDHDPIYQPPLPANPIDTTACGDAFAAGLLAGMAKGLSLEQALAIGAANGASVAEHYGAAGFLSFNEAMHRADLSVVEVL